MGKKVKISPRIKTGKIWQVQIDAEDYHKKELYAFLANSQVLRPQFNESTYRWELGPIGDRYTDEKINQLADRLSFIDPMTNKKIKEADPTNRKDPFFIHKQCKAKLGRDVQELDLAKAEHELVFAILAADPLCVIGKTGINRNPSCEWVIEDDEVDAVNREGKRERVIKVTETFKELSETQRKNLYIALGCTPKLSGTETPSIIADWLWERITEGTSPESLLDTQLLFLELTNPENKGKLDVTLIVEDLYRYGILRRENSKILYNGEALNTDTVHIVEYLRKPENSGLFLTLEEALTAKKKTN